jgi:hypothetical protein
MVQHHLVKLEYLIVWSFDFLLYYLLFTRVKAEEGFRRSSSVYSIHYFIPVVCINCLLLIEIFLLFLIILIVILVGKQIKHTLLDGYLVNLFQPPVRHSFIQDLILSLCNRKLINIIDNLKLSTHRTSCSCRIRNHFRAQMVSLPNSDPARNTERYS